VNGLDSSHAASREPASREGDAGPASVPACLLATALPGGLASSLAKSTALSDLIADDLTYHPTAAFLEQQTVYDPFVGGGSAAAVAHQLGRGAWDSDAWPLTVRLSQQRLAEAA
jgi:adenine-specific DNA methylase